MNQTIRGTTLPHVQHRHHQLSIPLVHASQETSEAMCIADHIALLDEGRMQAPHSDAAAEVTRMLLPCD